MGAESTPKNRSDASEIAASCFMFVLPHRSITPPLPPLAKGGMWGGVSSAANDNIFLVFSISLLSGDEVTITFVPILSSQFITSAMYSSFQHLNNHLDVGCTWMTLSSLCPPLIAKTFFTKVLASSGIKISTLRFSVPMPNCRTTARFCSTICWLLSFFARCV